MSAVERSDEAVVAMRVSVETAVRAALDKLVSSAKAQVRQVVRARIVLAAADGHTNAGIADDMGISVNTVRKWRGRFAERGLAGLADVKRSGRPRLYDEQVRVAVVASATSRPPHPAATWTHQAIAEQVAETVSAHISPAQVGRILADLDLKPHKVRGWLTRRESPDFWPRAARICDLYRNPPAGALLLSIDEKTAIAARSRKHPGLPAAPGMPGNPQTPGRPVRQEFEYVRHGTASLLAALDVNSGEVITEVIARNNAVTFTAFLDRIDAVVPPGTDIHVVLDNGSSHTARHTKKWFKDHPRWTAHFTPPHASWLNQIELVFSALTRTVLRYGDFASREDLIDKMDSYIVNRNKTAKPFNWTWRPLTEAT